MKKKRSCSSEKMRVYSHNNQRQEKDGGGEGTCPNRSPERGKKHLKERLTPTAIGSPERPDAPPETGLLFGREDRRS